MVQLPVFGSNVRTDVAACDCTPAGAVRTPFTPKADWEKNPLPYLGLEPKSALRLAFQSDALLSELSQSGIRLIFFFFFLLNILRDTTSIGGLGRGGLILTRPERLD